ILPFSGLPQYRQFFVSLDAGMAMVLRQTNYRKISVCKRFYPVSFGKKRVKTDSRFLAGTSLCCQSDTTSPVG
ncbi:MAG TPA: hypothetical protein VHD35_10870, partial [Chitinophagaceae bacterium]|nr:hypothetical protein [Chitinophagaceae bacterium]